MKILNKVADRFGNRKYVIQIDVGRVVEAALFEHHQKEHFCIPSQVGCALGCRHCATTYCNPSYLGQLQLIELREMINTLLLDTNSTYGKVLSFSSHGEPMLNWQCVKESIRYFQGQFSEFYLTSVGIVETMKSILRDVYRPTIYFSVHGSSDEERDYIVPAQKHRNVANIKQILGFCKEYSTMGGKCVWNYMLHAGNTSQAAVDRLTMISETVDFPLEIRFTKYINIGVQNGISEIGENEMRRFVEDVSQHLKPTMRPRVSDLQGIEANIACGQLRASNSYIL